MKDVKNVEKLQKEIDMWRSLATDRGEQIDQLEQENAVLVSMLPESDHDDWENPEAYSERVSNDSPFERDQDVKDWALQQLMQDGENADLRFDP